ncbi:MAG: glycosyltransferase [Chitinophagaceae bacterium]
MCRISVITSLYNSQDYLDGYFAAVEGISNKDELEILMIHNAPNEQELKIINALLPSYPFIKHIVVGREGLYATWNRGINLSSGDYITVWNVDDVHLPDSLKHQADGLDAHPEAALAYGDFTIVKKYGDTEGFAVNEPQFSASNPSFFRQHHIGCFPMWRRTVHETIGFFDEQFRLIADLDFQIRIAKAYGLVKIPQQLGYYLEGTPGNLSSNAKLQDLEHTLLHLRYGNFGHLYLTHFFETFKKFKIFEYKWFGEFHKIPDRSGTENRAYWSRMPLLLFSIAKLPRHIARKHFKAYFYKIFPARRSGDDLNTSTV